MSADTPGCSPESPEAARNWRRPRRGRASRPAATAVGRRGPGALPSPPAPAVSAGLNQNRSLLSLPAHRCISAPLYPRLRGRTAAVCRRTPPADQQADSGNRLEREPHRIHQGVAARAELLPRLIERLVPFPGTRVCYVPPCDEGGDELVGALPDAGRRLERKREAGRVHVVVAQGGQYRVLPAGSVLARGVPHLFTGLGHVRQESDIRGL